MIPLSGTDSWIELLLYLAASGVVLIYTWQVLIPRFFPARKFEKATLRITARQYDNEFAEIDPDSAELDIDQKLHDALNPASIPQMPGRRQEVTKVQNLPPDPEEEPILWE